MSLLDALLLDPYRINVWIALRSDGNKGSGTQSDPYDGGTADRLDAILDGLPPLTTVHVGPGTFQTRGFCIQSNGTVSGAWQIRRGWKLVGSGIDVTTLQLFEADTLNAHYYAIGHDFEDSDENIALADFAEVSDMTIDCNLGGAETGTVACGAARLKGSHTRLRRLKVINWGTKASPTACFVLVSVTADPNSALAEATRDAGIEECLVLESDTSSVAPCTLVYSGCVPLLNQARETFAKSPFIRNCFVDPGASAKDADFRALWMSSCIGGVVEGNQLHQIRTGGPYLDLFSIRSIVIRENVYRDVAYGPLLNLGDVSALEGITGVQRDGTKGWFTASHDLNLIVGDRIQISGTSGLFEGLFEITNVAGAPVYEFGDDRSSAGPVSGSFAKVYGIDNAEITNNFIELRQSTSGAFPILGIHVVDQELQPPPPYANRNILVAGNHIQYIDGAIGNGYSGRAVQVNGAENAQIKDNFVHVDPEDSLRNKRSENVAYFNNRKPDGTLIRGVNADTSQKYDELETEAEDALVLSLFNKR